MPQAGVSHDITLAVAGGSSIGFTLAKDKNNNKLFDVGYAPMLAPQQSNTQPTSDNVPIEQEITFQQTSFNGGMSEKRVAKGTSKIYDAVYADTRWKGKAMLPPLITAGPSTGVCTESNLGFESWTSLHPDSWSMTYLDVARNASSPIAGTYDALIKVRTVQLREHKTSGASDPTVGFSKPDGTRVTITLTGGVTHRGTGYFFINFNRLWLNGKTVKVNWEGVRNSSQACSTVLFIRDGSYNRTSSTDFPSSAAILDKGAGVLQTIVTKSATFVAEEQSATVSVSGGNQTDVCLMVSIDSVEPDADDTVTIGRVEVFDGSTQIYDNHITDALTNEVTGGTGDYSRIGTVSGQIYQSMGPLKGLTVTCTIRAKTSTASLVRAFIDDGATVTYSSYHTGGGAAETLTAGPIAMSNTASKTWVGIEVANESGTANIDTFTTTVVINHAGVSFFERSTSMYVLTQKAVLKWDNTNTAWIALKGFGASTATSVAVFDGDIAVALGGSTDYEYSTDGGTTWITSTLAIKQFDLFINYAASIWGIVKPQNLHTNTTVRNGATAWATAVEVGDTSFNVNSLAGLGANIYAGKANGVFKIDSTPAVTELMPEFRTLQDANNFTGMYSWQGFVFLPTKNGLYVYDGTTLTDISPPKYMPDVLASRFQGQFSVIAGDTAWLYVATTTGGLACVRQETIEGEVPETDWRWHFLYDIASTFDDSGNVLNPIDCMFVSRLQSTSGRLWIWGTSNSAYKGFYILLSGSTSPDKSSGTFGYSSSTDSALYLPAWDYGFPSVSKAFLQCDVTATGVTGGTGASDVWVQVKYSIDGGTVTTLGNITSVTSTLYFANTATGKRINIILNLKRGASAATTTTPIITSVILHAIFKPTPKRIWNMTVELFENNNTESGAKVNELPTTVAANLKTLLEAVWPLTFVDPDQTSWNVQLLPQSYHESPYSEESLRDRERTASFMLLEAKTMSDSDQPSAGPLTTKTADYTTATTDKTILVNTSGGAVIITLATSCVIAGKLFRIKDSGGNAGTNTITIATEAAELIDGAATYVINIPYGSVDVVSDGTNWFIL